MRYNNLMNYYEVNFSLKEYYKWNIIEIERLYPFERDIYLHLIKKENEKREEEAKNKRNRLF